MFMCINSYESGLFLEGDALGSITSDPVGMYIYKYMHMCILNLPFLCVFILMSLDCF
jgi:hypothetical protein